MPLALPVMPLHGARTLTHAQDVAQHNQWWMGMNNGMSKSWLMQDGNDPRNTRYSEVDGAPWSFVCECRESSLPQEILDAAYLFSPHAMLNLRGAMVPTRTLVPRIEANDPRGRWKVVGVWRKRRASQHPQQQQDQQEQQQSPGQGPAAGPNEGENPRPMPSAALMSSSSSSSSCSDDDDVDAVVDPEAQERMRLMRSLRSRGHPEDRGSYAIGGDAGGGIHDMDLDEGMPMLAGEAAAGMDLENIAPVRIEVPTPSHCAPLGVRERPLTCFAAGVDGQGVPLRGGCGHHGGRAGAAEGVLHPDGDAGAQLQPGRVPEALDRREHPGHAVPGHAAARVRGHAEGPVRLPSSPL